MILLKIFSFKIMLSKVSIFITGTAEKDSRRNGERKKKKGSRGESNQGC